MTDRHSDVINHLLADHVVAGATMQEIHTDVFLLNAYGKIKHTDSYFNDGLTCHEYCATAGSVYIQKFNVLIKDGHTFTLKHNRTHVQANLFVTSLIAIEIGNCRYG